MKTWVSQELVTASDLNANFKETLERSYTANGALVGNDVVTMASASTVERMKPSATGSPAAISTNITNQNGGHMLFSLATSGRVIDFNGGDDGNAADLYAQVRSLNTAEDDLSNGTAQAVFTTSNGTRSYHVIELGGDKFLVIYQKDNAGAANGIATKVVSVSGTTITVGSEQSIETTGQIQCRLSGAKLDTDKCLITYPADSDGDLYCQVLTVSGTTITTNTAVKIKAMTTTNRASADQIDTDTAIVIYQNGSSANLFGVTISVSGTTPTVNAEQTIIGSNIDAYFTVEGIDDSTALFAYSESTNPTNDQVCKLTISGATITKGSNLAIGSYRNTRKFGLLAISDEIAFIVVHETSTTKRTYMLDISGSTPTQIDNQSTSHSSTSQNLVTTICQVAPWIYIIAGSNQNDGDFLIALTPNSTVHVGMAEAAIADSASGDILMRFHVHTLTSFTVSPGSIYYVDDNGQPTTRSSSISPQLGMGISATDIILT